MWGSARYNGRGSISTGGLSTTYPQNLWITQKWERIFTATPAIERIFFLPFAIAAVVCVQHFTFVTEIFFIGHSKTRRASNRKKTSNEVSLSALQPHYKTKTVSRHLGRWRRRSAWSACMPFMCTASEEFGASHGKNGIGEKSRYDKRCPGDDR